MLKKISKPYFFALALFIILTSANFIDNEIIQVDCRWRTIYTHANGDVSYTDWTYGKCNVTIDDDGNRTLTPIT